MTSLFVGLYGAFLIAVGINGNSALVAQMISEDSKGYAPWLLALIVLAILSENENTKPLVMPFVTLLLLTFFLRNFDTIKGELSKMAPSQ